MPDGSFQPGGAPAPFHRALAQGPRDAAARWLTAGDGVRLRAVSWGRDAGRGTVLILAGRTEYAEKYGRVAAELRALGYASLTVDWRGQGLSDRLRAERHLGHVRRFADYQRDVAALVAHGRDLGLPEPWFLLAHSMGGCIGLRALMEGLPVRAAAFSAPMWGLRMRASLRPLAWSVSSASRMVALSHLRTPGQEPAPYVLRCDFAGNALTGDRDSWERMRAQVAAAPDLALGGPSLLWLNEALRETWALMRQPAPKLPALALVGSEEAIVEPARVARRMASWPGGRMVTLAGARHEVLMEAPAIRARAMAEVAGLFAAAGVP